MVELLCLIMLTSCLEVAETPAGEAQHRADEPSPPVAVGVASEDASPQPTVSATAQLLRREPAPSPHPEVEAD